MELKLFGKSIFNFKSNRANSLLEMASSENKESKYIPDFYIDGSNMWGEDYIMPMTLANVATLSPAAKKKGKSKKEEKKPVEKPKLNPKGVYDLKLLDDSAFKLNTNESYIDQQLSDFKDKLNLISAEEYDMRRGVKEISSMVIRLENRKKYPEMKDFFEQFAYTTSSKIDALLKNKDHDNLKMGQVAQFLADLPKEAVQAMKDYNKNCESLCGKQAVFYIIADRKDFQKSNSRRDPILLAQSPFGHVWQILGAWDEEMLFLEEL